MAKIRKDPVTGKFHVTTENMEEVLALSIQLLPGYSYRNINSEEILDVLIPNIESLPEECFALNNGVYIFRYKGNVYLSYGIDPCFERRVECYVPMSNGESFVSYRLQ